MIDQSLVYKGYWIECHYKSRSVISGFSFGNAQQKDMQFEKETRIGELLNPNYVHKIKGWKIQDAKSWIDKKVKG